MPTMLQLAAVLRRPEPTLAVLPQQNRRPVEPEPQPERRQVPEPVLVLVLERLGPPQGKETNLAALRDEERYRFLPPSPDRPRQAPCPPPPHLQLLRLPR